MADDTEAKIANERKAELAQEIEQITSFYLNLGMPVYHVYCFAHDGIIAIETVIADRPTEHHIDGATPIPIDGQLLSFRKRTDNTMGYSCICGANTILLPEEQAFARQDITLPHIQAQIADAINARPANYAEDVLFKRVLVEVTE